MDLEEFLALVEEELGLRFTATRIDEGFDEIPEWDSVKLLWLATALEQALNRPVPFAGLLEASSLGDVYRLVTAPVG